MFRLRIIFAFALSLIAIGNLPAAENHRAVRAVLMDFTVDDNSFRSAQKGANFTALLQAELSRQTEIEWVERAQLKIAKNELGLSAGFGLDDKRSAIRCGKWTKADWLITGMFSHDDQSQRVLFVEILDLQHADAIASREILLPRDKTGLDETEIDFVSKQLLEILAEAKLQSRNAEGQIALAPLFFFEMNNRHFEPDVAGPEFFRLLDQMVATNKSVRLIHFSNANRAQQEMEMVLSGFVEDDNNAWQKLADYYVWGTCGVTNRTGDKNTSAFWFHLNFWDGRSVPKIFSERIPFPMRGELPAKEISVRLKRSLEKILQLAQQRPSLPPSESARHEIAESLLKASAELAGNNYQYFPGSQERDRKFSQILCLLDTACFFEPQNAVAQMERLNHRYGFWMDFSFNLKNPFWAKWKKSEAWGRFVEQFGLKTVAPVAFPYKSVSDVYVRSLRDVLDSGDVFYGMPADLPSEIEEDWRRRANAEYEKRKALAAEFVKTNRPAAMSKFRLSSSATVQTVQNENSPRWQFRLKPMFKVPHINALPTERKPTIESISFPRNFDVTAASELVLEKSNLWIIATSGKWENDPNYNPSLAEDLAVSRSKIWTYNLETKQVRTFPIQGLFQASAILFQKNELWIAGDGLGVFDFETHALKRLTLGDGLPLQHTEAIAVVNGKIFVAGDNFKIYQRDLRMPEWSKLPINLRARSFSSETGRGMRLAAHNQWLIFAAGDTVLYNTSDEKWSQLEGVREVTCVAPDEEGFWLGSGSGLYFANPETGKIQSWKAARPRVDLSLNEWNVSTMWQMPHRALTENSNAIVTLFGRIAKERRSRTETRNSSSVPIVSRLPGGVSALTSDDEFLWVASNNEAGSYVLAFHKPSQKWIGCFHTDLNIISMAVSEKYLWFGSRSSSEQQILARIHKNDLLEVAKSLWVSGEISITEIQQLKMQLPVRARAIDAFFDRDYASVTRLLEGSGETDLEALFLLAYSYDPFGLNDAEKSQKYFQQIIRQEPDSPFAKIASDAIAANALLARERKLNEESLKKFDSDKNGILDERERLAMSRDTHYLIEKNAVDEMELVQNCNEIIKRLDSDADGKLDIQELTALWLKLSVYAVATPDQLRGRRIPFIPLLPLRELQVGDVLKQFDTNSDGKIELSELKEMAKAAMRRTKPD